MKVLVTGAAGVLGQAVVSRLEAEGTYDLRLTDILPLETQHEFVQADLADWERTAPLCRGVNQVLHIAAIHPWKPYTPEQYLECNIRGTWNLARAAAEAGVQRVIYTSSIAAMGYAPMDGYPLPFDESKPCTPQEDLYGISKHVGEQFFNLFRNTHGLPSVYLRPGCFIPCDEDTPAFGLGLLGSRLSFGDVADAHVLALRSAVVNEAIIITAGNPFTRDDGPALLSDARSVVLKYFPEAAELEKQGVELPERICPTYTIAKAQRLIGYQPKVTFETWLKQRLAG